MLKLIGLLRRCLASLPQCFTATEAEPSTGPALGESFERRFCEARSAGQIEDIPIRPIPSPFLDNALCCCGSDMSHLGQPQAHCPRLVPSMATLYGQVCVSL